jgi:PAS domain S-box-containing protein
MKNAVQQKLRQPVVFTQRARCRDCYRCVRVCPAGAIKMKDGQAQVLPDRCIACGTCIVNCPQHAKEYRSELGLVLELLASDGHVSVSMAPSFVSYFEEWSVRRIPSALRLAGFRFVGETAVGAWHSAQATLEHVQSYPAKHHICTACPAVVNYVLHQKPELAEKLVPVASPMRFHAMQIKKNNHETKVVFVGPCVAKKDEASWKSAYGEIDAVLTFEELIELFRIKEIDLRNCEESNFDDAVCGDARLFPLEGGLLRTAGLDDTLLSSQTLAVSGYREVSLALDSMTESDDPVILEPLFCKNGCIAGPSFSNKGNFVKGRRSVLAYSNKTPGSIQQKKLSFSFTGFDTIVSHQVCSNYSEDQIREVMQKTGKHSIQDELNCTACGYTSCRHKAIAVLDGLAELQMCMPFMRRMAENRYETIIARDPNGIVLLSDDLTILHMNPAFKRMFCCSDALIGRKISYLIDPDYFEKLSGGNDDVKKGVLRFSSYNLICHVVAYKLPEERQFAGVFIDITDRQMSKEKLDELKSETLLSAQELVDHQIGLAQEMARFLGDHTAKGELLLKKLVEAIGK